MDVTEKSKWRPTSKSAQMPPGPDLYGTDEKSRQKFTFFLHTELEFNSLPASESSALVYLPLCYMSEFSSPGFSESKSFPA